MTAYSPRQSFVPEATLFVEPGDLIDEEDSELETSLSRSISEVEQVFQDMGTRNYAGSSEPEVFATEPDVAEAEVDIEDVVVISAQPLEQADLEAESNTLAKEQVEAPEVESPYETEVDPVTGVYRLKVKTATAATRDDFHLRMKRSLQANI